MTPAPRLLAITPPSGSIDAELIDACLAGGARALDVAVLLREPGLGVRALLASERFVAVRRRLADRGIPALVSIDPADLVDPALASASPAIQGVQVRGDPELAVLEHARRVWANGLVGRSCHAEPQPGDEFVDYTVVAPIFAPRTAQPGVDKHPLGLPGLRAWTGASRHVLALGGIDVERTREVLAAGAKGIAGISLLFGGRGPAQDNVEALVRAFAAEPDRHAPPR